MAPYYRLVPLISNGVVVYPTSTLPGLGCLPNKAALDNLYDLKNRPAEQPVSLGVADLEQASELVEVPQIAVEILRGFPRGSLTLILDAITELDQRLGGNRVAVRVLADSRAIELVRAVGPITATSANHSGVEPVQHKMPIFLGSAMNAWLMAFAPVVRLAQYCR